MSDVLRSGVIRLRSELHVALFVSVDSGVATDRVAKERSAVARLYRQWVLDVLPRQVRDGSADDGAFAEYTHGWHDGRWSAFTLAKLIAARTWADQIGIGPESLDEPIARTVAFLLRRQSPLGEIDLAGAYSGVEAGFTVPGLVRALEAIRDIPELTHASEGLETYLRRAAPAVLKAEAMTANHRWAAVCAALASLNAIWPDQRYLSRIDEYLADGIDCDSDGLWHIERCPGYGNVANQGVMVMADRLGRADLLAHVVRNSRLTLYMLQPNGELDTSFSHRQNRASPGAMGLNYAALRRAAILSGDGRLSTLANRVLDQGYPGDMLYPVAFEIDDQPGELPSPEKLPTTYDLHLKGSQIVRRRAGPTAITVAADTGGHFFDTVRDTWGGARRSDDWIHLQHGEVVLQSIHLAVAGMHNIQPEWLEVGAPGHYRLGGEREGWRHTLHFRPGSPQLDVDWGLQHQIDIDHDADELRVRIRASAKRALIASLRIHVRAGVTLDCGELQRTLIERSRTYDLPGDAPLELTAGAATITIHNLPPARHRMPLAHLEPIPSAKGGTCGVLSLGLVMPVDLDLRFTLHTARTRIMRAVSTNGSTL